MKLKHINQTISEAKNYDHFASLPPSFLKVDIPTLSSPPELHEDAKQLASARIEHFSSPLKSCLIEQCLELFEENMGDFYRASSWGLDMEEKRKELTHDGARFLIVLEDDDDERDTESSDDKRTNPRVLGFAHFRYEEDDEDDPTAPVLYLYELQIQSTQQKAGMGKRLMNIMELLAMKSKMHKVMLTVFKENVKAIGFYLNKMKYEVDECSPSNFEGEENEHCDYEILSKSLIRRAK